MAKFQSKDIFFKDGDMAIFGNSYDSTLFWDGTLDDLRLTTTISGIDPIQDYHLTTRWYVDNHITNPEYILFGLQFHSGIYESEQQTDSTSYIEALKLTISGADGSGIEEGQYRIGWTFEWRQDKLNRQFKARVQIDDTDTVYEVNVSPYVDVNYFALNTGFYYTGTLTSGTHSVDLDFASSNSLATSFIKNARLEFWRVN